MSKDTGQPDPQAHAAQENWADFYDAIAGQPPRETLVQALDAFEAADAGRPRPVRRIALDIGCGEGRDTREILRRAGPTRWSVMANDSSPVAFTRLSGSISEHDQRRIYGNGNRMEELPAVFQTGIRHGQTERLARRVDLVNSSFALPHCRPEVFPALWEWIVRLIRPGGRFAGQLFGVNDEWAKRPDGLTRTYHTRPQVEALLAPFKPEHLEEVERPGKDAHGNPKYWHVFHLVARKH